MTEKQTENPDNYIYTPFFSYVRVTSVVFRGRGPQKWREQAWRRIGRDRTGRRNEKKSIPYARSTELSARSRSILTRAVKTAQGKRIGGNGNWTLRRETERGASRHSGCRKTFPILLLGIIPGKKRQALDRKHPGKTFTEGTAVLPFLLLFRG